MKPTLYRSTEVRWFKTGRVPFDAADLFAEGSGSPAPFIDRRTDIYLASRSSDLGLKVRGDEGNPKLEAKSLVVRRTCSVGHLEGLMESWSKWSWLNVEAPPEARSDGLPWIVTGKVRYQWKFENRGGHLVVVSGATDVDRGGSLEVTGIAAQEKEYWTFAVEAFDVGADAERAVEEAARRLVDAIGRTHSGLAESYGYPHWLALLVDSP